LLCWPKGKAERYIRNTLYHFKHAQDSKNKNNNPQLYSQEKLIKPNSKKLTKSGTKH